MYQAWPWGSTASASPNSGFVQPTATAQVSPSQWPAGYNQYTMTPEMQQQWAAWASQAQYTYSTPAANPPAADVPVTTSYAATYSSDYQTTVSTGEAQKADGKSSEKQNTPETPVSQNVSELDKLKQLKEQAEQWKSLQQPTPAAAAAAAAVAAAAASATTTASAVSSWSHSSTPTTTSSTSVTVNSSVAQTSNNLTQLSQEEEEFERQFKDWEKQFENWKQQNMNHPDKEAFAQYEKQWQEWRAQLLQKKEEMKKARVEQAANLAVQTPADGSAAAALSIPPVTVATAAASATPNPALYYQAAAAAAAAAQYMYMQPFMFAGNPPVPPPSVTQQTPYEAPPQNNFNENNQRYPEYEGEKDMYRYGPPENNGSGTLLGPGPGPGPSYGPGPMLPPAANAGPVPGYDDYDQGYLQENDYQRDWKGGRGRGRGSRGRGRGRGQSRWPNRSEPEITPPGKKRTLLPDGPPPAVFPESMNDVPPAFEYPPEDCRDQFGNQDVPYPGDRPGLLPPAPDRYPYDRNDDPYIGEQYPPPLEHEQYPPPPDQRRFPGKRFPPPDQDAFPVDHGRFPPPRYPPKGDHFPDRDRYPPEDPGFPPEEGMFPPEEGHFPPKERFLPKDARFPPPKEPRFPPEDARFPPPEDARFPPPKDVRFPPEDARFPPEDARFPPEDARFPPEDARFPPPEDGRFPPPEDGRFPPPEDGRFPPPEDGRFPPPEDGRFPPPDDGRFPPPDDGRFPPLEDGRFPPPEDGRFPPPKDGRFPLPKDGRFPPPKDGRFPPPKDARFPLPKDGRFPPEDARFPPEDARFPPDAGQFPPEEGRFPPEKGFQPNEGIYPPEKGGFPPKEGRFGPDGGRFLPEDRGYMPEDGRFPADRGYPRHLLGEGGFLERDFERGYPPPDDDMYGPPPFRDDFPPYEDGYSRGRGRFSGRGRRFREDYDRFGPPPYPPRMRNDPFEEFPMDDRFGYPDGPGPDRGPAHLPPPDRGGRPPIEPPYGPPGREQFPPDDPYFSDAPPGFKSIDYTHKPAEAVIGEDYNPHYDYESEFQEDVTNYRDFNYPLHRERSPFPERPFNQDRDAAFRERDPYREPDRESFAPRDRDRDRDRDRLRDRERDRDRDAERSSRRDGSRDRYDRNRDNFDRNMSDKERNSKRDRDWEPETRRDRGRDDEKRYSRWGHRENERDFVDKNMSSPRKENNSSLNYSDIKQDVPLPFQPPQELFKSELSETVLIEDLLVEPKRSSRPKQLVVILRGLPGSGKTYVARLIKDKEVENGGSAPRILSLDDYFMIETEVIETDPDTGKRIKKKEFKFEYELEMEEIYRSSLFKSFKKTIDDGFFPFIVVDAVHEKTKQYEQYWSYAKQKGFQVYIAEIDCMDPVICHKRNIHNRSLDDINKILLQWELKPRHFISVDTRSLLQDAAITEVEMEVESADKPSEQSEEQTTDDEDLFKIPGHEPSKWEKLEATEERLDQLDGIRVNKKKHSSMEDYLQLPDDYDNRKCEPGKKRVRWADLEQRKEQDRLRAIGFVVGQTDWAKLTDPTQADKALTETKYF